MSPSSRQIAVALMRAGRTALFVKSETVNLNHLMFGLLQDGTNASAVLAGLGIDVTGIRFALEGTIFDGPHDALTGDWVDVGLGDFSTVDYGSITDIKMRLDQARPKIALRLSERAKQALDIGSLYAKSINSRKGSTAYTLLGVLESIAGDELEPVLTDFGLTLKLYRTGILEFIGPFEQ